MKAPTNIIRLIKSRRRRWVGDVALMGATRDPYKIFVGNVKVKKTIRKT
jgi:hypothetical protein